VGLFFTLMQRRIKKRTTFITTQLGFKQWPSILKNDQLVNKAVLLLDVEEEFARLRHDGEEFDTLEPSTEKLVTITIDENWSVTQLGLYGKAFLFERGRLSPYLRAGAGGYSLRYSQDVAAATAGTTVAGNEQANKFGVSGGAGVRMRLVGGTAIGIETLYHNIFARDMNVNLWTTGLTICFGPTGN